MKWAVTSHIRSDVLDQSVAALGRRIVDRARSRGRQTVVLALGPVVGVVASVLTNVITADWNWWVFAGLVLLTTILAGSAVLTTQVMDGLDRSAQPPALPPPNALHPPVGTRAFSGRAEEQAILTRPSAQAEGGPLVMVITGMGGVGKTELAIRTATELASRYPDGCLWVELRTYAVTPESRPNSAQVLRALLNSLGEQPGPELAGVAELSARWRATTAVRRILLILDDVNDAHQIQPLIPGGRTSAVLITSRHLLVGVDADRTLALEPMDRQDAEAMAAAILGRSGITDRQAVTAIAARYRLPLALRSICDLRIGNPGLSLADLTTVSEADEAAAALTLSFDLLTADARAMLRGVSRYPGSLITVPVAAALSGLSPAETHPQLAELYQRGLLSFDDRQSYRIHDLVQRMAFYESQAHDTQQEISAANERVFRYTAVANEGAYQLLYPGASVGRTLPSPVPPPRHLSDRDALAWMDLHYADVLAVGRHAAATGYPDTWLVVYCLEYYQRIRGLYADTIELATQALEVSRASGNQLGQASMHQNIGLSQLRLGDYPSSRLHLETSLALYEEIGDERGSSMVHTELAKLERITENLTAARVHAESALIYFTRIGDPSDIGAARRELGVLDRLEGRFDKARLHFELAADLYMGLGQRRGTASCHRELGLLDHATGRSVEARRHLDAAMALYQEMGDPSYEADTLRHLAVLDLAAGNPSSARRRLDEALHLYVRIDNRRGQADVHAELGNAAFQDGDLTTATDEWEQATNAYHRLGLTTRAAALGDLARRARTGAD